MNKELLNSILSGLCTQYGSFGLSTPEEIVSVALQIQNEVYKQTSQKPVTNQSGEIIGSEMFSVRNANVQNQNGETVELKLEW